MEGTHTPSTAFLLFLIYLQPLSGCCHKEDEITVAVGQDLTLTCYSYYPDDGIVWKFNASQTIGISQADGDYLKSQRFYNDSRFTLVMRERHIFQLVISNISLSDSGLYECGALSSHQEILAMHVEVSSPTLLMTGIGKHEKRH